MNLLDRHDIEYLNSFYRHIWYESSTEINTLTSKISYIEQKENEKILDEFIKKLIDYIEIFPEKEPNRSIWKKEVINLIEDFLLNQEIFKLGILHEDMKNQFFEITKKFVKTSRAFDESISLEDIGQALRNVWIVNIFQKIVGEDIKFTDSIFGYSMLYPYTDNYLDNTQISFDDKNNFNHRFTKKLKGETILPINKHEEQVHKLLQYIENDFDRIEFPNVYDKLLLIHQGQINSISKQSFISIPYEKDILGVSIEKGGASVLADGYLIRGSLSKEEEVFAYGYGFFLQLCDDLQDVKTDIENKHMTIMSQLAPNYNLDLIANKLINLTINVVDSAKCFNCYRESELRNLIKDNCINMILLAIANSKEFFSKEYIKDIEDFLPFTLKYTANIKKKLSKKFNRLKYSYNSISIDEIIMYLLE